MENNQCPCRKKSCERHGNCDACREHHAKSKSKIPVYCERQKKSLMSKLKK